MFKIVLNMKLFIFLQESLLELLLSLYKLTDDPQLFLLAGKIILYYAENELVRATYSHILLPYSYMPYSYRLWLLFQSPLKKKLLFQGIK